MTPRETKGRLLHSVWNAVETAKTDTGTVLGLPDIPVCEDQWFHERYEEGRPEAVIVWMFITLGGLVSFLCGVAVGRWTA